MKNQVLKLTYKSPSDTYIQWLQRDEATARTMLLKQEGKGKKYQDRCLHHLLIHPHNTGGTQPEARSHENVGNGVHRGRSGGTRQDRAGWRTD